MSTPSDPGLILFGKTRRAVLAMLYSHPDESFYLREIARRTDSSVGAIQRELTALTGCGILRRDRQRFFQANPECVIFEPLKQIIHRTIALHDRLRNVLRHLAPHILVAFVFGSFARSDPNQNSDIDLMIVTRDDQLTLEQVVAELGHEQATLGREINPFVLTAKELRAKRLTGNSFITRVLGNDKIFVIGDAHDLAGLAEKRLAEKAPDDRTGNRRASRTRRPRPKGLSGTRAQR